MVNTESTSNQDKKKIELALSKIEVEDYDDEFVSKGGTKELISLFSSSIDEVTEWFKNFQVESIEISISGIIETSGVTKLVVSAKGEGGMKVVLKPKLSVQKVS
jgi:phosphosulfolactate synthase (CoM biosynthesis protein A)